MLKEKNIVQSKFIVGLQTIRGFEISTSKPYKQLSLIIGNTFYKTFGSFILRNRVSLPAESGFFLLIETNKIAWLKSYNKAKQDIATLLSLENI